MLCDTKLASKCVTERSARKLEGATDLWTSSAQVFSLKSLTLKQDLNDVAVLEFKVLRGLVVGNTLSVEEQAEGSISHRAALSSTSSLLTGWHRGPDRRGQRRRSGSSAHQTTH